MATITIFVGFFFLCAIHSTLAAPVRFDESRPADLECETCKIVVELIQELLMQNTTEHDIVNVVTRVCIDLKIEDENVCTLVVREFKVYTPRRSLSRSPSHYSQMYCAGARCLCTCIISRVISSS